jgi:hypothetical protein
MAGGFAASQQIHGHGAAEDTAHTRRLRLHGDRGCTGCPRQVRRLPSPALCASSNSASLGPVPREYPSYRFHFLKYQRLEFLDLGLRYPRHYQRTDYVYEMLMSLANLYVAVEVGPGSRRSYFYCTWRYSEYIHVYGIGGRVCGHAVVELVRHDHAPGTDQRRRRVRLPLSGQGIRFHILLLIFWSSDRACSN